jgi:YD repeat-containing protein
MRTYLWKLSLGFAFIVLLTPAAFAAQIFFTNPSIYAHESAGSVTISVTAINGQTDGTIGAHPSSGLPTPNSTAILFQDYTTNAQWRSGAFGWGAGANPSPLLPNNGTVSFDIPLLNNHITSERVIQLFFFGGTGVTTPSNCVVTLVPDPLVTLVASQPQASQIGPTPGQFTITRYGDLVDNLTINYTKGGTATYTTDYTLSSGTSSVVIPANQASVTINVSPVATTNVGPDKTVVLSLAPGTYTTNAQSTATVVIANKNPVVNITAPDPSATEGGDSGLFTNTRTADPSLPLTVLYTIGGTAVNGTDYALISNSVVIPAGQTLASITIAPTGDVLPSSPATVSLTLITTNGYVIGAANAATVSITNYNDAVRSLPNTSYQPNPNASHGRFVRGTGTNATFWSFVVPVDLENGVALDNIGGNATNLFPSVPWTATLSHYNATNTGSPISFQNPIASFGGRVGGSPLYYGQGYTFGIYAGDPAPPTYTNANSYSNALQIQVYQQSNMAFVGTISIPIPNPAWTNEWTTYLTNGFTKTVSAFGLTTTLTYAQANLRVWDVSTGTSQNDVAYHITHTAAQGSTNYVYEVELAGGVPLPAGWLVKDGSGTRSWSRLYTMEFEQRPPWRATVVTAPNFQGVPLPPAYVGMSPDELATNSPPVTNAVSIGSPTNFLTLDQSPELRRHPILDDFVADMGSDPILLANYVMNEIELTDAIDYNDNGSVSDISVNEGGVSRGAYGVFLEKQGSPIEQCALLVYLLRQAGVPAVYEFAPQDGLLMTDSRLSTLLRLQIRGAVNNAARTYTTNRLIPVNYPWVAAYIGTNWVHIFPWLKDTQVTEGFDLNSYLPAPYNNPYTWVRQYIYGASNIMSLSREDDTPTTLFPLWLKQTLNQSAPGMSLDDFGMRFRNRPQYRSRWQDFPNPTYVTNYSIAVDTLSSWGITNVNPALTNIFDIVNVTVQSVANPGTKVTSGDLNMAELNNRRFLIRHETIDANNTSLILSLEPYRTNITKVRAFASATQSFPPNTNALCYLQTNRTLGLSDDLLQVTIAQKFHRALPSGFTQPAKNDMYLGYSASLTLTNIRNMSKGDFAAICLDVGRVTKEMLDVHAQTIWQMEHDIADHPAHSSNYSPDEYQGDVLYLMGMSLLQRDDAFWNFTAPLYKAKILHMVSSGLAGLIAKRDQNGLLPSGQVILVQPKVDMLSKDMSIAAWGGYHSESGDYSYNQSDKWFPLAIVGSSADEHYVLNTFFKQSDSVSTIKLLHLAQTYNPNGIVEMNRYNYQSIGNTVFSGSSSMLKDIDPSAWAEITSDFSASYLSNNVEVFMTPGLIRNLSGSYLGAGTLILSPLEYAALISPNNLNGGWGETMPDTSFTSGNLSNTQLGQDPNENYAYDTARGSTTNLFSGTTPQFDIDNTATALNSGTERLDPSQTNQVSTYKSMTGDTATKSGDLIEDIADTGAMAQQVKPGATESVSDPVNSVTGDFYVDDTDLVLPGPMPLQIRRNYSSINLFDNSLGYGWKLSYFPYLTFSFKATNIFCSEPDGTVVNYRRTATNSNVYLPQFADNPRLQNVNGSVANIFNGNITKTVVSGTTNFLLSLPDGTKRLYVVRKTFAISTINRWRPYLDSWTNSSGNFLKFSYGTNSVLPDYGQVNRVEANNGNFIALQYNFNGHITDIMTGDGRHVRYDYDSFGDLVSVTRPDNSQIQYQYQHLFFTNNVVTDPYSTHLLTDVVNPGGRVTENTFDSQRRVIKQSATVGYDLRLVPNGTFVYSNNFSLTNYWTNYITGSTFIFDCYSNLSQYYYTNSLLCKIIDPSNRTNIQSWYTNSGSGAFPNSLKSTVDYRGLTTTHYYDSFGNPTNVTIIGDLTGTGSTSENAGIATAYNSNFLITNRVDAAGNRTAYTYTNALDPYLPTTEEHYASNGTLISVTAFTYGNVTNVPPPNLPNFVGSFGLLQRTVRAAGTADAATNDVAFDAHGFPIQTIQYSGKGDPDVTNYFFYNLRGELVERDDNAGRSWFYTYDGLGRTESKEVDDEFGNLVSLESYYYNENGEVEWIDGPLSDPEDYVFYDYDGAGRKVQEVHWRAEGSADGSGGSVPVGDAQYATSFYEYDPFGNLIKSIDPRGNYQRMIYDKVGQLVQSIAYDAASGQALATNRYAYEPGGQIAFATNGLGGITAKRYTSAGKLESQSNLDGSTNAWTYYLDGRSRREYGRNGAFWETTYDDANRAKTKIYYSASLTPLETNFFVADRRGNMIQRTDAAQNIFSSSFDGLDRVKTVAGPQVISIMLDCGQTPLPCTNYVTNVVQQIGTNFYDLAGINFTNVNAFGEKTVTTRDVLGRITLTQAFTPNGTRVRVSQNSYSSDQRSVTKYEGSTSQLIPTEVVFDNDGRVVLTSRFPNYPATNVVEFTQQTYDSAGNRIQSAQCSSSNGVVTIWNTNTWAYDGLNRPTTATTRDGAVTSFSYDALSDVISRSMPGNLSWAATYNSAGEVLSENDKNGVQTTRNFTYAYYSSSSPYAGLLNTITDNRGVTRTNSYDDYLRVASAATTGSLPEEQMLSSWQYDVRGLLTNVVQSFASGATGPTTSVFRQYDAYGQLVSESVTPGTTITQGWDAVGRRTSSGNQKFQYRADGRMVSVNDSFFGYGDNGLLISKTNGSRVITVDQRDGEGKPLQQTTKLNSTTVLGENWSWTGDDLPSTYTAARSDFTDARRFAYASASRRLAQETFNLNSSQSVTNNYTYDNGTAGGLGVLTKAGDSWSVSLDAFSRVSTETNSIIHRTASGNVNGAATLRGYLNGQPLNLSYDHHSASAWLADVALSAGSTNTLAVYADHPSGLFTTNRNSTFTVPSGSHDSEQSLYDGSGNVTNRVWKRADGTVVRSQSLTWDAFGDLVNVTDLDGNANGFKLVSIFDGLGRQVQTIETTISNNVALATSPSPVVVTYSYDPQSEFLIEGINITQGSLSRQDWFSYGPDMSGVYGGMHGVGGLEEIATTSGTLNTVAVLINDYFGNVLGAITNNTVGWNASRQSLYAPAEGYAPPRLSLDAPAYASLAWRTRTVNAVGYVQLGARPYDPIRRAFMASDPLGHDADPALNTAFGGNPAAFFDADGRDWQKQQHLLEFLQECAFYGVEAKWGMPDPYHPWEDHSYDISFTSRVQLCIAKSDYAQGLTYSAPAPEWNWSHVNLISEAAGAGADCWQAIAETTDSPSLGATAEFISYFCNIGRHASSPTSYANQAKSDYHAAGGGVTGTLGVVNRYNPTKPFYDVASGIDLIDAHQLDGVERTSAGLNAFGTTLLVGTGTLRPSEMVEIAPEMSVVMKGAGSQQIAFGSDMSSWAQTLRYTTKNWNPAGNVAVFEYTDAGGNLQYAMGYAQRMVGHAEQVVGQDLISQGINPMSVTKIYSEFSPCTGPANCSRYIQQNFPNAQVFYSFSHDAAGRAAKAAAFSTFP